MEHLLYYVALGLIKSIQALPLPVAARLGRLGGALFYWLDPRHRRVALKNLSLCFASELSPTAIRAIAKENFRRIGESYCCAIKTSSMSWTELLPHCEFVGTEKILPHLGGPRNLNVIVAIGHFGNFELYGRYNHFLPGIQCATTYRGIRPAALDRLLLSLRQTSGCRFFERRTEADALKNALAQGGWLLGLLSDQNARHGALHVPFFGHDCATTAAPAVLALRYKCPLFTGVCYRVGLAKWRIEAGHEIPTRSQDQPRSKEDITRDINLAFETAIRKDPANWFWVHNRWKGRTPPPHPPAAPCPNPPAKHQTAS